MSPFVLAVKSCLKPAKWVLLLRHFALNYSHTYLVLCTLTALVGALFLLSFPLLALLAVFFLIFYTLDFQIQHWPFITTWLGIFCLAIIISQRIFRLRFPKKSGFYVSLKKNPLMFDLIRAIENKAEKHQLQEVVITETFKLDILYTPKYGMPFYCEKTLAIGLPVLLTLSPVDLENLLLRKCLRPNGFKTYCLALTHQLRELWPLYLWVSRHKNTLDFHLLQGFFKIYTPLYLSVTQFIPLIHETQLDRLTLEKIGDEDTLLALEAFSYARHVTEKIFFAEVLHKMRISRQFHQQPFNQLTQVMKKSLTEENFQFWIQQEMARQPLWESSWPEKLNNLGFIKALPLHPLSATAAEYFLGPFHEKIIKLMNTCWEHKMLNRWKSQRLAHSLGLKHQHFKSDNSLFPT